MNTTEALDFAIRNILQSCDLATNTPAVEAWKALQDLRNGIAASQADLAQQLQVVLKHTRGAATEALADHATYVASVHLVNDPSQHHGRIHGDQRIGYRADCSCGWAQP